MQNCIKEEIKWPLAYAPEVATTNISMYFLIWYVCIHMKQNRKRLNVQVYILEKNTSNFFTF